MYLDFTNFLKDAHVQRLAEADQHELVQDIREYYADFQAVNRNHFTLDLGRVVGDQIHAWDRRQLQRCTERLLAVLLALKKRPLIRYEVASTMAVKLAGEVKDGIRAELATGLFDLPPGESGPPVLVILDRRSDLLTPLLLQWTYQAMLHELFGIDSGCTDLGNYQHRSDVRSPSTRRLHNLVPGQDSFLDEHLHANIGVVSDATRRLVDAYREKTSATGQLESFAGIKRFLEDYPQLMQMSAILSKHVEIASEAEKITSQEGLLDVSEVEQGIACGTLDAMAFRTLLLRSDIAKAHKFRLALLYLLKAVAQSGSSFSLLDFFDNLRGYNLFTDEDLSLLDFFLKFTQTEHGSHGGTGTGWSPQPSTLTRLDENVYTQHLPPLIGLVDALVKGRLRADLFPLLSVDPRDPASAQQPAREIILFVVGGSTYEEACHLERYTSLHPNVKIALGGTQVLNSTQLIQQVRAIQRHLQSSK